MRIINPKSLFKQSRHGFSVMVTAMIIVVFGAAVITTLLPPSASAFDKVGETSRKLEKIRAAVNTYYSINTEYPCPASFTLPINNSAFGYETNTNPANNCQSTTACSGTGLACPVLPALNKTWIGAVPVRTIGLPDDYEFDAWGNRFTYAVNNQGKITINNIDNTTGSVGYYALSHGPDGLGAYSRNGNIVKTCSLVGASLTLSEYQNCNFTTDDIFLYRQWNTGTDFYDDIGLN